MCITRNRQILPQLKRQIRLPAFRIKAMCVPKKLHTFKDQVEKEGERQPGEKLEYHIINAIPAYGQNISKIQKRV